MKKKPSKKGKKPKVAKKAVHIISCRERIDYHVPSINENLPKPKDDTHLEFWLKPQIQQGRLLDVTRQVWYTDCGRYKITRNIPHYKAWEADYTTITMIDRPGAKERLIKAEIKTIERAIETVVRYHETELNITGVTTNEHEFIAAANHRGLGTLPGIAQPSAEVPVSNESSIPTIDNESSPRLQDIKVPKTPNIKKDKWGAKIGFRTAKINAVITNEPKSPKQIAEESGTTSVHGQLLKLLKDGHVIRLPDDRYKLKETSDESSGKNQSIGNRKTDTPKSDNKPAKSSRQSGKPSGDNRGNARGTGSKRAGTRDIRPIQKIKNQKETSKNRQVPQSSKKEKSRSNPIHGRRKVAPLKILIKVKPKIKFNFKIT